MCRDDAPIAGETRSENCCENGSSKAKIEIRIQGIDLNQEMEQFYGITNQALAVLVQDVEGACDAALQTISKIKSVNFLQFTRGYRLIH